MKVQCKNCLPKEGIEIPDFPQSDKNVLMKLKLESSIHTVKHTIDNFKLSHVNAKYITTHINVNYGHCNNCIFDQLDTEYINCPKCGALNFNWKIKDEI
jgi:hypothetical protein